MAEYSPMMQKYLETKEQYRDCILFYRLGDFYEMFFDDAVNVSRELELTLTGKDCGQAERAPMCGVPFHAADTYINRLVEKGYKVAICEQVEDPKQAKGLVKRDIIRIVTPGSVTESSMLVESISIRGRLMKTVIIILCASHIWAEASVWPSRMSQPVNLWFPNCHPDVNFLTKLISLHLLRLYAMNLLT